MIVIADSGSTKTHWVALEGSERQDAVTMGLNPRLADDGAFDEAIAQVRKGLLPGGAAVGEIYFYGAGCGTEASCNSVKAKLERRFAGAAVSVGSDLLGACRAVCGNRPGMVGILGTGSNLCYYDGEGVARRRTSTGYILGDEGSGNHIGRRLLKDYLEERMPEELRAMFHETYGLSNDQLLDRLYRQPYANRWLASLASFAAEHRGSEYIASVLADCFEAYFSQLAYFGEHSRLPLDIVGGLTASFSHELTAAAKRLGVPLGTLVGDPMEGLIRFHDTFFLGQQ